MVNINGQDVNARTVAMLGEVERLSAVSNIVIVKGKHIEPGDSSAGTHDGYGVVDLRTKYLTVLQRNGVLLACREVGFAAWYRTVAQGFSGPHIHAVAMGDPDLSPAARRQVTAYRTGHNGLANNGPDDGPKGFTGVLWESYKSEHSLEAEMNDADRKYVDGRMSAYALWLFMRTTQAELAVASAKKDTVAVATLTPIAVEARKDWEAATK